MKKLLSLVLALVFVGVASIATYIIVITSDLPKMITLADYEPLLVSQVYDRNGQKIGEYFREKRILVPYEQIPEIITQAFIASEDDSFFEHGGINLFAIFRAFLANLKAGRRAQGGSTITQQVARSLLLSSEKTYARKIKEVILAYKMEANLSKKEILYLYLNQIYLGHGAYGVAMATQIYFRKPIKDITLPEAALIAGLPQAPSRYSPIRNAKQAKARQTYVLGRMEEEGFINEDQKQEALNQKVTVYIRKDYKKDAAFYLEAIRQLLVKRLGENQVLDKGIKIFTGLDLNKQIEAQLQVRDGLRSLDKRQGYRGPLNHLTNTRKIAEFLLKTRNDLIREASAERVIQPNGTMEEPGVLNISGKDDKGEDLPNIPPYIKQDQIVKGVVTKVDDEWGLTYVRFAESKGLIDFETMEWARKSNPKVKAEFDKLKKPSDALKKGDVVQVRIIDKKFSSSRIYKKLRELKAKNKKNYTHPEDLPEFVEYTHLELEQEPLVEGSLISLDQKTSEILAMVGGYDFNRSQFNRTYQAARQTGSSFKALVYTSALDKGYTPATPILDAPIVYEEEEEEEGQVDEEQKATKKWKPNNHGKKFSGDILFRNALILSLNVPTVKIIEKISVDWVAHYARRLGIFSPLNMDFTLALGSSGITLYEMTKAFAQIGNLGKKISPLLVHKVEDKDGNILLENLSLDERFEEEMSHVITAMDELKEKWKKENPESEGSEVKDKDSNSIATAKTKQIPPLFFNNKEQLIKPTTAYITTSILQGAIEERGGTGARARSLGRPVAGKTGTTNGYYDAWFVGYTPDIATGVWVGFDEERTLGRGEVGGRSALPIWLEYMKLAHKGLPVRNFPVPQGIVFANIDNKTGKLASSTSDNVVKQAFIEGTEPKEITDDMSTQEDQNFFKEDLSE